MKNPYKIFISAILLNFLASMTLCQLLVKYEVKGAFFIALVGVIVIALYSRRIVEKAYGYTLKEAIEERLKK
jgi:hypothetical protein